MNIIQTVFFGTIFNGTLWYLYAMFWTWIILFIFRKAKIIHKCYFLIPVLLFIQIFGRAYVQSNYDINEYVVWFRNMLTFGLPFALLGEWIAKNEKVILEKLSVKSNILVIFIGCLLIVVEFLLFTQYMDTHVSTVFIATGLFVLAIRQQREISHFLSGFAYIGARWSMWIYLVHMFVSQLIHMIFELLYLEENLLCQYTKPFLVCIMACIISELLVRIKAIKFAR